VVAQDGTSISWSSFGSDFVSTSGALVPGWNAWSGWVVVLGTLLGPEGVDMAGTFGFLWVYFPGIFFLLLW
jgi:hypothetical protein